MKRSVFDTVLYFPSVRLMETFDMSTTVKFVYVKWSGGSVPFTKRGRYGVVQGSIEKLFVVSSSLFRQLPCVWWYNSSHGSISIGLFQCLGPQIHS